MIPIDWIRNYVNQLLDIAGKLPQGPLRNATVLRADHAMDLLQSFQNMQRAAKEATPII